MNPTIQFILYLRRHLEGGQSAFVIAFEFSQRYPYCEISRRIRKWHFLKSQGLDTSVFFKQKISIYQRQVFFLLERSTKGESILPQLVSLEEETGHAVDAEIQKRLAILPLQMLFPLLLLQFPAVAGVILWPFLENLFHSLS